MWPMHAHHNQTTWCRHSPILWENQKQWPHIESFGERDRLGPASLIALSCSPLELLLVMGFVEDRSPRKKNWPLAHMWPLDSEDDEVETPTYHPYLPLLLLSPSHPVSPSKSPQRSCRRFILWWSPRFFFLFSMFVLGFFSINWWFIY